MRRNRILLTGAALVASLCTIGAPIVANGAAAVVPQGVDAVASASATQRTVQVPRLTAKQRQALARKKALKRAAARRAAAKRAAAAKAAAARKAKPAPTPTPPAFRVGIVHTRFSADAWNNQDAVASAKAVISRTATIQNQHIMGWGAGNPNPSPGVYDWGSLDDRVALMRATGGEKVLTLCGAPDWMKGGAPGTTDWSKIEVAPTAAHYNDFANLAVQVAKRYPDVKTFTVWNELKGFYDSSRNRWNIEAYTQLYNKVYTALKAYNPTIKVGGPYVVADSVSSGTVMSHPYSLKGQSLSGTWGRLDGRVIDAIDYWLANKVGGDFLAIDGGIHTRDLGLITDPVTSAKKFGDVTRMIRAKTTLPVWWMETYARKSNAGWGTSSNDWASSPQVMSAALTELKTAGAAVAFLWDPQGFDQTPLGGCDNCLWTDTRVSGGGMPTGFADVVASFR